jgi:hypothetical protein
LSRSCAVCPDAVMLGANLPDGDGLALVADAALDTYLRS